GKIIYSNKAHVLCVSGLVSVWCGVEESGSGADPECLQEGKISQTHGLSLCGVEWRNQDQEQIQNVFKRFLFHYSKAHNSVGSVQRESHSVHPLMRLSPRLSPRRKKQQVCASDFLLFLLLSRH
uniref:Neuromedin S n=1 Tax=Sinocyclocheilus rhinocerous TaxID=307959 RepID=A0A673L342_9TELE